MHRIVSVIALLFFFSPAAQAYIDPGSGFLLIQGVLALIGGVVVFVRHPVRSAKRLLERLRKRRDA